MKKAAIYARVSSSQQSVKRQIELLNEFINNDYVVVDTYTDVKSGYSNDDERFELQRLKKDAEEHKFEVLFCYEFTRLARKVVNLNGLIEFFNNLDIEIYFLKQNLWIRNKNDLGTTIVMHVLAVMGEYESDLFADRTITGKLNKFKSNLHLGGFTPFGYKSVNGRLVICEEEAEIVRLIFQQIKEGKSQDEICDYLNANQVKTAYATRIPKSIEKRRAKQLGEKEYKADVENLQFKGNQISRIAHNELYIGKRSYTQHEPDPTNSTEIKKRKNRKVLETISYQTEDLRIIDDDLFYAVKEVLAKKTIRKDVNRKNITLLRHKLRCGMCGGTFASHITNGEFSYLCTKSYVNANNPKIICEDSFLMNQIKLDTLVTGSVKNFLLFNLQKKETNNKREELENDERVKRQLIDIQEGKINDEKNKLKNFITKSIRLNVDDEIINEERERYNGIISKLEKEYDKLVEETRVISRKLDDLNKMKNANKNEALKNIYDNPMLLRDTLNDYIEVIKIYSTYIDGLKFNLVAIELISGQTIYGFLKLGRTHKRKMRVNEKGETEIAYPIFVNFEDEIKFDGSNFTINWNTRMQKETFTNISDGVYSIAELYNKLGELNYEMWYPKYDFHKLNKESEG